MPLWLFKRVVMGEISRGDRMGFGILDEKGDWLGTVELYEITRSEATLGILIGAKNRWGQGYGTDAVKAVLTYAFSTLRLDKVKLRTYKHNLRAQRAFEKAGFHRVDGAPSGASRFYFSLLPRVEFVPMEITREDWERF